MKKTILTLRMFMTGVFFFLVAWPFRTWADQAMDMPKGVDGEDFMTQKGVKNHQEMMLPSGEKTEDHHMMMDQVEGKEQAVDYYTCKMHSDVHVSVENYEEGETSCPVCNMWLIPVNSSEKEIGETLKRSEK